MKYTLEQIKLDIKVLEAMVDKYHRCLNDGTKLPFTYETLLERSIIIAENLSNLEHGKHLTMRSPEFRKMMVIAKNIDNMK